MAEARRDRGLLHTSVVIDLERVDPTSLPTHVAVSALTMAELAAGPHATTDPDEHARRPERLQICEPGAGAYIGYDNGRGKLS